MILKRLKHLTKLKYVLTCKDCNNSICTKKSVTNNIILPGTELGGIIKLQPAMNTAKNDGRKYVQRYFEKDLAKRISNPIILWCEVDLLYIFIFFVSPISPLEICE